MSFQVIPVPAVGAEDVVVGTRTGRTRARSSPAPRTAASSGSPTTASRIDRVAHTGGRPLGIEIDLDGRLLVCDAHRGLLRVDTAHRSGRAVTDASTAGRMVFCNNAAVADRRDGLVLRLLHEVRRRAVEGRLRPEHPHRAAAAARHRRRGRGGPRRAGLRQRGGAGAPTSRTSPSPRPARRTVVRRWLTGDRGGHARPAGRRPARLPRQHRPRQRRPDLGHDRRRHATRSSSGSRRRRCWLRQAVTRIPDGSSRSRSGPCGCRRTTTPARSCTTSTCRRRARRGVPHGHRRPRARRAGCGWAACTSRRSRWLALDRLTRLRRAWATSSRSRPRVTCATSRDDQLDELATEIRDLLVAHLLPAPAATSVPTSASSS